MDIKVYLHRTKKQNFEVADCFSVTIDFNKIPEEKRDDLEYLNAGFKNDCKRIACSRNCIKKYGVAYISFIRPQYEDEEKDNGTDKVYFDNTEMLFMKRKPKRGRKKKEVTDEKQV